FGFPLFVAADGTEVRGAPLGSGIEWVRGRELYPRLLREDATLHYREHTRSRAQLLDWLADLALKIRLLKQVVELDAPPVEAFPAVSGTHCRRCPCEPDCPLPARLRNFQGSIHTDEQFRDVAEAWDRTTSQAGIVRKAIK